MLTKQDIIKINYCKLFPDKPECACLSSKIYKPHCFDFNCIYGLNSYKTTDMMNDKARLLITNYGGKEIIDAVNTISDKYKKKLNIEINILFYIILLFFIFILYKIYTYIYEHHINDSKIIT